MSYLEGSFVSRALLAFLGFFTAAVTGILLRGAQVHDAVDPSEPNCQPEAAHEDALKPQAQGLAPKAPALSALAPPGRQESGRNASDHASYGFTAGGACRGYGWSVQPSQAYLAQQADWFGERCTSRRDLSKVRCTNT